LIHHTTAPEVNSLGAFFLLKNKPNYSIPMLETPIRCSPEIFGVKTVIYSKLMKK